MIRVHITDDHKMLVEGLRTAINDSGTATVSGVSHTLADCRRACAATPPPDVLLLDINMPDGSGIDFCAEICRTHPGVKILMLSSHNEYTMINRAVSGGASGYILKNSLSEEVVEGIETVMEGGRFLCREVDALMKKPANRSHWLTTREQELLRLIVDGYSNLQIADKMCLSIETIKTYRKNLIQKLGAKNSMELVKMAMEEKLV